MHKHFNTTVIVPGDPSLIKRKMHIKKGILKTEIFLDYKLHTYPEL